MRAPQPVGAARSLQAAAAVRARRHARRETVSRPAARERKAAPGLTPVQSAPAIDLGISAGQRLVMVLPDPRSQFEDGADRSAQREQVRRHEQQRAQRVVFAPEGDGIRIERTRGSGLPFRHGLYRGSLPLRRPPNFRRGEIKG